MNLSFLIPSSRSFCSHFFKFSIPLDLRFSHSICSSLFPHLSRELSLGLCFLFASQSHGLPSSLSHEPPPNLCFLLFTLDLTISLSLDSPTHPTLDMQCPIDPFRSDLTLNVGELPSRGYCATHPVVREGKPSSSSCLSFPFWLSLLFY